MFNRLYQNHRVWILIIYAVVLVAINFLLFDKSYFRRVYGSGQHFSHFF